MPLSRDARHLALPQVGRDGQRNIAAGTALVIGVGGIGCAAATYLAAAGVGHLMLCDFDTVDETNLGRQFLFTSHDIGKLKADVAAKRLWRIHPDIRITPITRRLIGDDLLNTMIDADVVLDGCDNFATRFQVSDACVFLSKRLISGSAIRLEGQAVSFGPDYGASPCYRCLYSETDESLDNCAGNGVLSPVPGVIGTIMATEALKYLAGIGGTPGRLLLYDAADTAFRTLTVAKREACNACSSA